METITELVLPFLKEPAHGLVCTCRAAAQAPWTLWFEQSARRSDEEDRALENPQHALAMTLRIAAVARTGATASERRAGARAAFYLSLLKPRFVKASGLLGVSLTATIALLDRTPVAATGRSSWRLEECLVWVLGGFMYRAEWKA